MTFVVVILLVCLLMAVLKIQTSGGTPNGFILLSCSDIERENLSAGPCLLRGYPEIRRDDYTYTPGIGGHKVHTRAALWNEARLICEDEGGYLAIINSIAEAKALIELMRNSEPVTGSPHPDFFSIGFHDLYSEGQYTTIHGQSLARAGYSMWANGQPDNAGGAENCGSLHQSGLNDINCGTNFGFICEIPATY